MMYEYAIEVRDYTKIEQLNKLTNSETFWDDVRKLTKKVTSDHSIKRWQALADLRYKEILEEEQKTNWIIGCCDSSGEGVYFYRVHGTVEQAKAYLFNLMKEDRERHDKDDFDFTTDYSDGVHGWYGVNCYYDSHIDFTLEREDAIECEEL